MLLKEHHGKGAKSLFLSAVLYENWFIQAQQASADLLQTVTHRYRLVGSCNDQIHDLIRFCQYLSRVTGLLLFLLPQVVSASSTVSLPCSICLFFYPLEGFCKGTSEQPSAVIIPLLSESFLYDCLGVSKRTTLCINRSRPNQTPTTTSVIFMSSSAWT